MSEITKCTGENCPIKDDCKRFTLEDNKYHQSYFSEPPCNVTEGKFECLMFWGNNAQAIWNELLNATHGKNNT